MSFADRLRAARKRDELHLPASLKVEMEARLLRAAETASMRIFLDAEIQEILDTFNPNGRTLIPTATEAGPLIVEWLESEAMCLNAGPRHPNMSNTPDGIIVYW
jgi:hypothetical protein